MTLVPARALLLALTALLVASYAVYGQPLESHLVHVLVTTTEDIDDIAINPDDGHLLVLRRCAASCGGVPEYLDHYTADGSFVMRIPLTQSVNRILPVGSTLFLALASSQAAGGLFRLAGAELVEVPMPVPFGTSDAVNGVWRVGPDAAIYLLQTSIAAGAGVVMRMTPGGGSSVVSALPDPIDMVPLDDGVEVATRTEVYLFPAGVDMPIRTLATGVVPLTSAPISGRDGFVYGTDTFDGFPGVFRMPANGGQVQGLYRDAIPWRGLVAVTPGIVYGFSRNGGAHGCGQLMRVRNGAYANVYSFPPAACGPQKLLVGSNGELYGMSTRSVSRIYMADSVPTDVLLYNQTTGDRLLATVVPGGSVGFDAVTWAAGWEIFPADFNHDAERDLLFYDPASGLFVKGIGIGDGQFDFSVSYFWAPNWDIHVVDLDGNGQSDLFLYNPTTGRWFAAMTVGDGTDDFDYSRNGVWARGWTITPVDWDGDGRTDLFAYNKTSGLWVKVTTLADSTFDFPALGYWAPGWNIYDADFDGDGKSELFLYANAGTPIAGRNFVVRAVGDTFEYTEGMRWGPNWTVTITDLDGDGRSDIFLYDPATGWWYEVFKDGAADSYYSGLWAKNWSTAVLHGGGNTGVLSTADALMVYSATSGVYFKVTPAGRGAFDYIGGTWPTGMTLIPMR